MDKTLEFLHLVHQMKRIERFKDMPFWKNTRVKRWDSDAEHTYRVALIAMIIQPFLKKKYDFEKLLKIFLSLNFFVISDVLLNFSITLSQALSQSPH